jgi:hypothetical protein
VKLNLGRLGLDQRPDLQGRFLSLLDVPDHVAVAGKLDLMGDFQRFGAAGTRLRVDDGYEFARLWASSSATIGVQARWKGADFELKPASFARFCGPCPASPLVSPPPRRRCACRTQSRAGQSPWSPFTASTGRGDTWSIGTL